MLLRITNYRDLDERKLMDVYSESNFENTDYFYPEEMDKEVAVGKVESGFLELLKNDFFKQAKPTYWVFEEDGVWIFSSFKRFRSNESGGIFPAL